MTSSPVFVVLLLFGPGLDILRWGHYGSSFFTSQVIGVFAAVRSLLILRLTRRAMGGFLIIVVNVAHTNHLLVASVPHSALANLVLSMCSGVYWQ